MTLKRPFIRDTEKSLHVHIMSIGLEKAVISETRESLCIYIRSCWRQELVKSEWCAGLANSDFGSISGCCGGLEMAAFCQFPLLEDVMALKGLIVDNFYFWQLGWS